MAATHITLAEAKSQLNVDYTDDDTYIQSLCDMAEQVVTMEIQGVILGEGTVETDGTTALVGDDTNFNDFKSGDVIKVDDETDRIINTITDDDNLTVTVAFTNTDDGLTYEVAPILPVLDAALPLALKHAMLLLVAHYYASREPVLIGVSVNKLPLAFDFLINPWKHWTVK